jgi:hypothetical protein
MAQLLLYCNYIVAGADHWIPLWGFGMGNDFGDRNETYFTWLARSVWSSTPVGLTAAIPGGSAISSL